MTFELTMATAKHGLRLGEVIPLLQGYSVISDNTFDLEQIGKADSEAAIVWLDAHPFEVSDFIADRTIEAITP